jgi:hypothetical protein
MPCLQLYQGLGFTDYTQTVLFFYLRLTERLSQQRLVKFLAIAVGVTYIIVLLEILLHCRPIQRNWQIKPYAGGMSGRSLDGEPKADSATDQCTLYYGNLLTVTILNVL